MNDRVAETYLVPAQTQDELIEVLCNSLYPGASREGALMVLGYCKAAGLDPLLKPVHLVPMRVKTGRKNNYGDDEYVNRDTVMPGIGLYRVKASQTGQYAGKDAPEFGPMVTMTYQSKKRQWVSVPGQDKKRPQDTFVDEILEYPEWCKVTVYRLVAGLRSAFTAVEYWEENYATAGRDTEAPNEMWAKRTRGQLAKCAEAQALRMGFTDVVGSQPTAEEMEGKAYSVEPEAAPTFTAPTVTPQRASAQQPAALPESAAPVVLEPVIPAATAEPVAAATAQAPAAAPAASGSSTTAAPPSDPATPGEIANVMVTARTRKVNLAAVLADLGLAHLDPTTLAGMSKAEFKAIKAKL